MWPFCSCCGRGTRRNWTELMANIIVGQQNRVGYPLISTVRLFGYPNLPTKTNNDRMGYANRSHFDKGRYQMWSCGQSNASLYGTYYLYKLTNISVYVLLIILINQI
jgi:hypothetical protein